ncbi:hypothetical protein IW248_006188 [Micromonospora ureilytica]|uniref:Uncharacterized protein n=1 Tax=Micromonospora ureilytica TaxID=709868 RepID=A0ABS0JSA2_9ACTN|nr:hypothetical protein [Micromonospora ureilytica]
MSTPTHPAARPAPPPTRSPRPAPPRPRPQPPRPAPPRPQPQPTPRPHLAPAAAHTSAPPRVRPQPTPRPHLESGRSPHLGPTSSPAAAHTSAPPRVRPTPGAVPAPVPGAQLWLHALGAALARALALCLDRLGFQETALSTRPRHPDFQKPESIKAGRAIQPPTSAAQLPAAVRDLGHFPSAADGKCPRSRTRLPGSRAPAAPGLQGSSGSRAPGLQGSRAPGLQGSRGDDRLGFRKPALSARSGHPDFQEAESI